jgi:MFS family permease
MQFFDPTDVNPPKRFNVFCGCLVFAILGAAYASFNVVASVVAAQLRLSASEVTLVANAGVLGSWLHITNGPYVASYGPLPALRAGIVLWLSGFVGIAAVVNSTAAPSFWVLAVLNFIAMQGASFATMAALAMLPALYNGVDRPGMMAALGSTFALGQAFISTFYAVLLRNVPLEIHFIAVASVGLAIMLRGMHMFPQQSITHLGTHRNVSNGINVVGSPIVATPAVAAATMDLTDAPSCSQASVSQVASTSPNTDMFSGEQTQAQHAMTSLEAQQRDVAYMAIIGISALFFCLHLLQLYAETSDSITPSIQAAVFVFSCCVLVIASVCFGALPSLTRYIIGTSRGLPRPSSPLLPVRDGLIVNANKAPRTVGNLGLQQRGFPTSHERDDTSTPEPQNDDLGRQQEIQFPAMLGYLDFWLLLLSYFCCGGLASAVNSIVSLVVTSLAALDSAVALQRTPSEVLLACGQLYALAAMGRCWGGLCVGRVTEFARLRFGLSRLAVCLCCHALSVTAYSLLYATLSIEALYFTLPLVNFAWGMLYSSSQVVAVETFGSRSFAHLWGALSSSPCVSTFLFAIGIAGRMADSQLANGSLRVAGHLMCFGRQCYHGAMGWFAVVAYVGMFSLVLLAVRRQRKLR